MNEADREQRIRQRAHEIWEAAGRAEGSHEEHWHAAEREITAGDSAAAPPPSGPQEKPATKPRTVKTATAAKPAEEGLRPAAPRRRPATGTSPLN